MDPIFAALIAGLAKLAEPAVRDAYDGLKNLIVKKLGARHAVPKAVVELEEKPESPGRKQTLKEEVAASGLDEDKEIVSAAKALTEQLKKLPGGQQVVQQNVTGDRNIFSGTGDVKVSGPQT